MKKEEAIELLEDLYGAIEDNQGRDYDEAFRMAIEALQVDVVQCNDCKHQNECEEVVLFDINDDEIMGHHIHWCSYGRSKNDKARKA